MVTGSSPHQNCGLSALSQSWFVLSYPKWGEGGADYLLTYNNPLCPLARLAHLYDVIQLRLLGDWLTSLFVVHLLTILVQSVVRALS